MMYSLPGISSWNIPHVLTNGTYPIKDGAFVLRWHSELKRKFQKDVEVIHVIPSLKTITNSVFAEESKESRCQHWMLEEHFLEVSWSPQILWLGHLFPHSCGRFGKMKVVLVGMGEGNLVHSRKQVLLRKVSKVQ